MALRKLAKKHGIAIKGARVVVQGFGNVGSFLAKFSMMLVQRSLGYLMLIVPYMLKS